MNAFHSLTVTGALTVESLLDRTYDGNIALTVFVNATLLRRLLSVSALSLVILLNIVSFLFFNFTPNFVFFFISFLSHVLHIYLFL